MPPPTMKIIVYILRCETYKSTTRRNEKKKHSHTNIELNQRINLPSTWGNILKRNKTKTKTKTIKRKEIVKQLNNFGVWLFECAMHKCHRLVADFAAMWPFFCCLPALVSSLQQCIESTNIFFFCSFSLLAICESKSILFMESAPSLFLNEYNFFYFFLFLLGQTPLDVIRNREWVMIAVLWLHFAKNKLDCSYFNYNLSFVMGNLNIILTRIFKYLNMKKKD